MRIMLVDDEADIRTIAKLALADIGGHEVELVERAEHAVETACRYLPDVILLDRMMPQMDGKQVFIALRADSRTQHIPILFMTANADDRTAKELGELGALGVIAKPFDPMGLATKVTELLETSPQKR